MESGNTLGWAHLFQMCIFEWITQSLTFLAVAHRLMSDDIYEGRLLPAGSLILGNAWCANSRYWLRVPGVDTHPPTGPSYTTRRCIQIQKPSTQTVSWRKENSIPILDLQNLQHSALDEGTIHKFSILASLTEHIPSTRHRICAGKDFALQSLFINVACMLSVFQIGKAVGQDGQDIIPSTEYKTGLICRPMPFKCSLKPRSSQSIGLINDAYLSIHT